MPKRLALLATGGTIACTPTENGLAPTLTAADLLGAIRDRLPCEVEPRDVFQMDSSNMQPEEWCQLARAVDEALRTFDGAVITHGTDTMAYTASALRFMLAGVRKLAGFGVAAINIPDGPRASSRMSPSALALLIERSLPVETILHYCCRDRNLLGMQSDLLGHYALGLRNILIITGDPPKLGDYPSATAVFDVDSIGLTRMVNGLNHGHDLAGNPIGAPTGWHIGVGANPGALDLDLEIARLEQKAAAGAEYLLTQPVFDPHQLESFFKRTEHLRIPVLAGIMPVVSHRTVEYLNNEVPGVVIPEEIVRRFAGAADSAHARETGIEIARKGILELRQFEQVSGLYVMPPFTKDKYDVAIEVLQVVQ